MLAPEAVQGLDKSSVTADVDGSPAPVLGRPRVEPDDPRLPVHLTLFQAEHLGLPPAGHVGELDDRPERCRQVRQDVPDHRVVKESGLTIASSRLMPAFVAPAFLRRTA